MASDKLMELGVTEREAFVLSIIAVNGNASFSQIADAVRADGRWGNRYTRQQAWEDFHNSLRRHYSMADVKIGRALVHSRLNALLAASMPPALQGSLNHYDRALATIKQMRELMGLDAPVKVDIRAQVDTATDVAAGALVAALGAVELSSEQREAMLSSMREFLALSAAEESVA
jgi:hypothetical protein